MTEKKEKFSTSRTAQILDVSTNTLKRWYKWYRDKNYQKPIGLVLPTPDLDSMGTMYFSIQQIQELQKFHEDLKGKYRGCMAEFNAAYQWGKRGTKIMNIGKQFKKGEK